MNIFKADMNHCVHLCKQILVENALISSALKRLQLLYIAMFTSVNIELTEK